MFKNPFSKKKTKRSYDKIPNEFFDNPKLIWQAQIKGEKNFDACSFMGALNDLQGLPDWQEAFKGIEHKTGMPEFLERLQNHFDLCLSPSNTDGSTYLYQHPSRITKNFKFEPEAMVLLVQRHMQTLASAYKASGHIKEADMLKDIPIKWTESDEQHFPEEGSGQGLAGLYPSEAWDFSYRQEMYKNGIPTIVEHIEEAAYSLANDFGLQRYLMQSFMKHGLDVDAQYELEWINNCIFYFDENSCYVAKRPNQ